MRRFLLATLALVTAAAWSAPNVVVIFCDDAGYGDFGYTGHPIIRTPNIDRMASEGAKLTQFYSASPACTASRYSLLTGRYPKRSGMGWVLNPDSPRGIHVKELTIAEALKQKGYRTAIFGKWHLGYPNEKNGMNPAMLPLAHGFDEYVGLPYSNDMLPEKGYPQLRLLSGPYAGSAETFPGYKTLAVNPNQSRLTALYTERALSFIRRSGDQPFFLYLPYAMPHVPLFPGTAFAGRSARGLYGDVIEEIDWSVGQILGELRSRGLADETLVFFTSDNGPWIIKGDEGGSAGLFRDGKGSTWEGGVREPAIAWWPGRIRPSIVADVASTMDILPTALELTGQSAPLDRTIDGRSLAGALLRGESRENQPHFYYGLNQDLFAVRDGAHKLHIRTYSQTGTQYFGDRLPLLFDLMVDPSEKNDITSSYPELVTQLKRTIADHQVQVAGEGSFWDQQN